MKSYVIDRHPLVQRDLFEIVQYIGPFGGWDVAERKVDEIEGLFAKLADFPHIGTIRNEIVPGLRALPAAEKATICFIVNDETRTMKIVCVTYAGQDWQQVAKSREDNT